MNIDKQWLTPALTSIDNAKTQLVYAVRALERSGGDFDATIRNIKETIGDLEVGTITLKDGLSWQQYINHHFTHAAAALRKFRCQRTS